MTLNYYELNEEVRQRRGEQVRQEERRKSSNPSPLKQPLLSQSNLLRVTKQVDSHPNYYETVYGNYYLEICISNYL